MKKTIAVIMALAMAAGLTACGNSGGGHHQHNSN